MRKNKKDWDIETLLSVVGFVFELMRVITIALRKRGGTVYHLRRLIKEPALVDKTVAVLLEGEHCIRVNRGPFPAMSTLEKQFSQDGVSWLFNARVDWKRHSSRFGVSDVVADDVVMVVKEFSEKEVREIGGLTSENIIAWGLKNDLVPADEKETYAFGINSETAELQRQFWLVGLGAFALNDGHQYVAVLRSESGRRYLSGYRFGGGWVRGSRFLFVRKAS